MSDDKETDTEDANTVEGEFSGVDPIYQNSAYPVTYPAPMDEVKQAQADHEELLRKQAVGPGFGNPDAAGVAGAAPTGDDEEDDGESLEDLTVADLRARASELDIAGRSSMNHDELVKAIAEAEDAE